MHEPTVYEILNSTQKGNKQTSRLLHALEELAGRLESVSAHGVGGVQAPAAADSSTTRQRGSRRYQRGGSLEFSSLQLPDPQADSLPLFPGASEFDALQAAATSSSSQLRSRTERHAWRSWLMAPSHVQLVVEAAWLLLALLFRQDDPCAAALQERVHKQLSQHYVSEVLSGQGVVENAAGLWAQALADAACHLLRSAFPSVAELADAQLQHVLQRQLRLWTTGLLPSDIGAPSHRCAQQAAAAADADADGCVEDAGDSATATAATTRPGKATRSVAAPFVSVKPGPLVSSFMAAQGIKPAAVLHTSGPQLRKLTVTQQQQQQQQQWRWQLAAYDQAAAVVQSNKFQQQQQTASTSLGKTVSSSGRNVTWGLGSAAGDQQQAGDVSAGAEKGSRRVQAAACLAAAAAAAEQYSSSKKAGAAAASRSRGKLQTDMQQQEVRRRQMMLGGSDKLQAASNQIVGWLSEPSGGAAALPASVTDAQCKAQRQLMQSHLRHGKWKLAHTFNATVHDKCLDMAAAVAVVPPPPASNGPGSGSSSSNGGNADARFDRPGGGWADIAGCSLVSSRLSKARAGGGAAAAVSATKVTKAAKAIVEDVRRKYAASPAVSSPPKRR